MGSVDEDIGADCAPTLISASTESTLYTELSDGGGRGTEDSIESMEVTETDHGALDRNTNGGDVVTEVSCAGGGPAFNGDASSVGLPDANGNLEPLKVLNLTPTSLECNFCPNSNFPSEEALGHHLISQHPVCGHCRATVRFQDIPNILTHFKSEHRDLKRCEILIAEQTLFLMNKTVQG